MVLLRAILFGCAARVAVGAQSTEERRRIHLSGGFWRHRWRLVNGCAADFLGERAGDFEEVFCIGDGVTSSQFTIEPPASREPGQPSNHLCFLQPVNKLSRTMVPDVVSLSQDQAGSGAFHTT